MYKRQLLGFFGLVFGDINEEEKAIIEEKLIETYKLKNITFDDNTLYKDKNKFKESRDMTRLQDFYEILGNNLSLIHI